MKYYLDTEFIEGFHRPFLGRRRHFVDLISIGIVAEDGREYYAVSKDFNPAKADKWVVQNVLDKIVAEHQQDARSTVQNWTIEDVMHNHGKSNKQIATEIHEFINPHFADDLLLHSEGYWKQHNIIEIAPDKECPFFIWRSRPEFYGYYSDYDWVVFCSLFGRMIDLPEGFPMYCRDLKQQLDEVAEIVIQRIPDGQPKTENWSKAKIMKLDYHYPKEINGHNALDDARWNKKLHEFIIHKRVNLLGPDFAQLKRSKF